MSPVIQFFGKTSFGFYLLHMPVMIFLVSYVYPATKSLVVCAVVVASVSYLFAYLMYRFVEYPGIELGRRVVKNL